MSKTNAMYKVKNRSDGRVVYSVMYNGNRVNQSFNPGETKLIPYEELRQLSYQPGGPELLYNYFMIGDQITNFLNVKPEPEYYMNEEDIKKLLSEGSLDEFLDCLDFAPIGVLDLLKKYAVDLHLSDYNKRKAIKDKLGFDVDAAIKNNEASKEEVTEKTEPTRRVKKEEESENTGRRTTPKYKVINKQE